MRKTVKNKEDIKMAEQLSEVVKQLKDLQKIEVMLKDHFKSMVEGDGTILAGPFTITIAERSRESLERDKLEESFGHDKIMEFVKTSTYQTLSIQGGAK